MFSGDFPPQTRHSLFALVENSRRPTLIVLVASHPARLRHFRLRALDRLPDDLIRFAGRQIISVAEIHGRRFRGHLAARVIGAQAFSARVGLGN